jgi:hypothetical protein
LQLVALAVKAKAKGIGMDTYILNRFNLPIYQYFRISNHNKEENIGRLSDGQET